MGTSATPGVPVTAGAGQWAEALAEASRVLTEATGAEYWVTEWSGFDSDDAAGEEWLLPVYAERVGQDLGHGVADAALDGWLEWLLEQAREV